MPQETLTPPQTSPIDQEFDVLRNAMAEGMGFELASEATPLTQEQTEALLADFPNKPTGQGEGSLMHSALDKLDRALVSREWVQKKLATAGRRSAFNRGDTNVVELTKPYDTMSHKYFSDKGVNGPAADLKLGFGLRIAESMAGLRESNLSLNPLKIAAVRVFNHKDSQTPGLIDYVLPGANGIEIHAMRFFGQDNQEPLESQVALVRR